MKSSVRSLETKERRDCYEGGVKLAMLFDYLFVGNFEAFFFSRKWGKSVREQSEMENIFLVVVVSLLGT